MFSSASARQKMESHILQLRSYPFLREKDNAELCAKILLTILEQHTVYTQLCHDQVLFLEHFNEIVTKDIIEEDDVFDLLEDLLIIVREKTLRTGLQQANEVERMALCKVSNETEWRKEDRTLFTEAFFFKAPLSIIKNLSEELTPTTLRSIEPFCKKI